MAKKVDVTLELTDGQYEVLQHDLPLEDKTIDEYASEAVIGYLSASIDEFYCNKPPHDELYKKLHQKGKLE